MTGLACSLGCGMAYTQGLHQLRSFATQVGGPEPPCLLFLHHREEVRCKERNQDMVSVLWGPAGL